MENAAHGLPPSSRFAQCPIRSASIPVRGTPMSQRRTNMARHARTVLRRVPILGGHEHRGHPSMPLDSRRTGAPAAEPRTEPALEGLFAEVYERLKGLASRQLARGARGTLDTTALVHELYLRINTSRELAFEHPAQFFTYAARAMESAELALALDEALSRLERTDARAARVVELRYFAGLSPDQIAGILKLARRTVDRDWRYARAFLHATLE
jgi:DNA-directed RNA polymerase specialized sigma24 family protein